MKKLIAGSILLLTILLTGCSIEIDTTSGKDEFSQEAEKLEETFTDVFDSLERLSEKETLSSEDQAIALQSLEQLLDQIESFKEAETESFMTKVPKKIAVGVLEKREENIKAIHERAVAGELQTKDITEAIDLLSEEFQISLFK
ncbi:hypothetical protein [Bacillus sp. AK128]